MKETGFDSASVLTGRLEDMTPEKGVQLVRQLCAQLSGDAESFHGNIWPGNVRLDWDGRAILGEASDAPVADRGADQVEYAAPEFFWDGMGSAAADVYSLGMLLYAACDKGYLPFQPKGGALTDRDRSGALRKRMKGEPIAAPVGVSPLLGDILQKALAYEPESRYLTAAQLLAALNETDEALPEADGGQTQASAAVAVDQGETPAEAQAPAQEAAEKGEAAVEAVDEPEVDTPDSGRKAEDEPLPNASAVSEKTADAQQDPWARLAADIQVADEPNVAPEPAAQADDDDFWNTSIEPAKEPASAEDGAQRYTVQKDFDGRRARRAPSAAPASARKPKKKKVSAAIPVLCVLAVLIIAGAVYALFFAGKNSDDVSQADEQQSVSEPFVVTASEAPAATESPAPTMEPEDEETPADGEEETADDQETAVTGSATVDGYTVTAASDTVYITGSGVNLRSGPSTTYGVEATLSRGVALQRTGTVNGWSQVQYEGEEYYVSSTLVSTTKPDGTDSTTSTISAAAGTSGTTTSTSSGTSNGTTTTSTSSGTTSTTTTTGTTSSGTTSTGSTGASTTTVTATRDVVVVSKNQSNLRSGPGTSYTLVATLDQNTVLQRTGTVNGWSRVVYQGQEVYIYDSLIETQSATTVTTAVGTLTVSSDVNVRSGAGTDNAVLGVAKTGESLTITGLVDGKWYQVSYNGQEGYVNRNLIKVSDFALVADKSGTATVTSAANVRSGPNTSYNVLGVAEANDTLTVTGLTDSNWYQVSYNDQVGYIAASLVTVS